MKADHPQSEDTDPLSRPETDPIKKNTSPFIITIKKEHVVPILASLILIGAGWLVFIVYQSYAWPAFLALLLYVGFDGINKYLIQITHGRRNSSALITTLLVVLVLMLPSIFLLSHLVAEIINLASLVSQALTNRRLLYTLQEVPYLTDFVTAEPFFWVDIVKFVQDSSKDYTSYFNTDKLGNWVSNIFVVLKGSVSVTMSFLLNLILTLIILFFLLRDGPGFYKFFRRALPFPEAMTDRFTEKMRTLIRAVLWGNVMVSFMQGAAISIGLSICNINNSVVYGAIAAIFSMIPIVGTAVVWAPTALYLALQGNYGLALFISIYGIAMYLLLENIFKPKLLDRKLGMHPLLLFLAILGGLAEFGITGVILGPLFVSLFMTMWDIYHIWGTHSDFRVMKK